jgi:peptidoglycan/LPS O-acetylase OafA/YrhL
LTVQTRNSSQSNRRESISFLNSLRGLVIAQIVLLHAFFIAYAAHRASGPIQPLVSDMNKAFQVALHDSTLYFTAISGILYVQVFQARGPLAYLKSRAAFVLMPFVVFTLALSTYKVNIPHTAFWIPSNLADYIKLVISNLVMGSARFHLWYIPILTVLTVMSPLTYELVRRQRLRWFGAVLIILPVIFTRSGIHVSPASLIFFLGAHIAGMYIGQDPRAAVQLMLKRLWSIAALALVSTGGLAILSLFKIQYVSFVDLRESLYYIQKMSLFMLLMVGCYKLERRLSDINLVNTSASLAFGIYLLHLALIEIAVFSACKFVEPENIQAVILLTFFGFLVGLGGSILIARGLKALLGGRSKIVIGC